ncbi:MAG: protease inhibitor I42 family protein [Clostridia bacterium]|nr:protease inhibitor I42 family protein [Clostridia bacterium]
MLAIFQKIIAFFMSVLAFFGIGPKPGPAETDIPDFNAGEVLEMQEGYLKLDGSDLIIALRGNPTTGYDWEHAEQGDSLVFKNKEYKQDAAAPNTGGVGGTFTFTYELAKPGETTLTFTYARPWETGAEPLETVIVTVVVSEDLKIGGLTYVHS